MQLDGFGVWTSYGSIGEENAGEAARLVEGLGYTAFWLGGSPQVPALRPLLEATERIVVATGIVNVWQSEPARVAADFAALDDRFPGRVLVGIGIGHPEATSHYATPLTAMREFLDGLDARGTTARRRSTLSGRARPEDARPMRASARRGRTPTSCRLRTPRPLASGSARRRCWRLSSPASSTTTPPPGEPGVGEYAELYLGLRNYTSQPARLRLRRRATSPTAAPTA